MCRFQLEKQAFQARFNTPFDLHFEKEKAKLLYFIKKHGFVEDTPTHLFITARGQLFVRNIVSLFDEHLQNAPNSGRFFSKAV